MSIYVITVETPGDYPEPVPAFTVHCRRQQWGNTDQAETQVAILDVSEQLPNSLINIIEEKTDGKKTEDETDTEAAGQED